MADRHTDSRVSAEDVERAARALMDDRGFKLASTENRLIASRRMARAVLSSIEAVPKKDYDELWAAHQKLAADEYFARAESAEARCESYRTALEEAADDLDKAANQFESLRLSQKRGQFPRISVNPDRFTEKAAKARAALAVPQEGKPR